MDEKRSAKKDVIEEALRRMGKSPGDHDILMIGDCMHDVEGAKLSFAAWTASASIRALRPRASCRTTDATYVFHTIEDMAVFLLAN